MRIRRDMDIDGLKPLGPAIPTRSGDSDLPCERGPAEAGYLASRASKADDGS